MRRKSPCPRSISKVLTVAGVKKCKAWPARRWGWPLPAREAYRSAVMAIPLQARRQAARYGARDGQWPWRGHAGRCSRQGGRALAHGQGRHRSIGGAGRTGSRGRGQGESREGAGAVVQRRGDHVHRGARGEFAQCPKHRAQWSSTLETYAYPHTGGTSPWRQWRLRTRWPRWSRSGGRSPKPPTGCADGSRQRRIMPRHGIWRDGENPARWRGHVATHAARARKGGPGRASCRAALGRDLHVDAGRAGPRCHSSPCTRIHHPDRGSDWETLGARWPTARRLCGQCQARE